MGKVLFFSGVNQQVADIFCEMMPEGFEVSCHPYSLSDEEKANLIREAEYVVLHKEPISPNDPLLTLENVILSPHVAGHAYEGWARRTRFAWQNIQRVAAGQTPISLARPEGK